MCARRIKNVKCCVANVQKHDEHLYRQTIDDVTRELLNKGIALRQRSLWTFSCASLWRRQFENLINLAHARAAHQHTRNVSESCTKSRRNLISGRDTSAAPAWMSTRMTFSKAVSLLCFALNYARSLWLQAYGLERGAGGIRDLASMSIMAYYWIIPVQRANYNPTFPFHTKVLSAIRKMFSTTTRTRHSSNRFIITVNTDAEPSWMPTI